MRRGIDAVLVALSLGSAACPSRSADGGSTGTSTGATTDNDNDNDDGGVTGSNSKAESGGEAPGERGICDVLIECATQAGTIVTPLIAAYGPEGTCWEEFPTWACIADCEAQLTALSYACQSAPACCEGSTGTSEGCPGTTAGCPGTTAE
jgi:hypothetical protein